MGFDGTDISMDGTYHLKDGKPLYEMRYESVQSFHEPGIAPVKDHNGWHFININESKLFRKVYLEAYGFYDGLAAVRDNSGYYHIDLNGDPAYDRRFQWVGNYQEDVCTVKDENGSYYHISRKGKPLYNSRYRYAGDFRDGIAVIYDQDGLANHIDKQGNKISKQGFLELQPFHKGFAVARDSDGYFHVDLAGNPIYEVRYQMVEPFYNGVSFVTMKNGRSVLIDRSGNQISSVTPKNSVPHLMHERQDLMDKLVGYWQTQICRSIVMSGIFDTMADGINDLDEIVLKNDLPKRSIKMILDVCRIWGLVDSKSGKYSLLPKGELLTDNYPTSLKNASLMWGDEHYEVMKDLYKALKQEQPQFDKMFGKSIFEYYSDNKDKGDIYNKALKEYSIDYSPILENICLNLFGTIVDVGGGSGNLLSKILDQYPSIEEGFIFDIQNVKNSTLNERIQFVKGDVFKDKIPNGDFLILSRFLHDWNNEQSLEILNNINSSLNPSGKLILFEMIKPENPKKDLGVTLDFNLLVTCGGKERTFNELQSLLKKSGFEIKVTYQTKSSIISAIVCERRDDL